MTCKHGHNDQFGDCGECPCPATGRRHHWTIRSGYGFDGAGCKDCSATPSETIQAQHARRVPI